MVCLGKLLPFKYYFQELEKGLIPVKMYTMYQIISQQKKQLFF